MKVLFQVASRALYLQVLHSAFLEVHWPPATATAEGNPESNQDQDTQVVQRCKESFSEKPQGGNVFSFSAGLYSSCIPFSRF